MLKHFDRLRLTHFSTYAAMAVWGEAAYMSHPTLATLPVFLIILPVTIVATVVLAKWEKGRGV